MKEQEILEYNEMLAIFRGWTQCKCSDIKEKHYKYGDSNWAVWNVSQMQFHKSFDWLMPVIQLCYDNPVEDEDFRDDIAASMAYKIDINKTYKAVVEFVKQFNKENK